MTSIFDVTKNTDTHTGSGVSDTFIVAGPTTDLSSADTLDGVASADRLQFLTAGTVVDDQFTNLTSIEQIYLLAKSGGYNLTLGAEATQSGINLIDSTAVGGTVKVDASALLNPLTFYAGKGANTLLGTVGSDLIVMDASGFSSSDKITGGGFGDHDRIALTGKVTVADGAFANVNGVESLAVGYHSLGAISPAKVTLGALSEKAGLNEINNDFGGQMTVDAGTRTIGVTYFGNAEQDIFIGSAGIDTFEGNDGDDSYRVKTGFLTSADAIHGGQGMDEIRLLDAGTLLDSALGQVTGVERLTLDGTGKQSLTLGTEAQQGGIQEIDAGKVTGGVVLSTAAMTTGVKVTLGTGADALILGGKAGVSNDVYVQSAKLTTADQISGVAAATDMLHFTDAVKLTDAYFAGLKGGNILNIDSLALDSHAKGQSIVAGQNFGAFVAQNALFSLIATSDDSKSSCTFDFSAYAGPAIAIGGTVGSDVFIEGSSGIAYIAAASTSADGTYGGDTIKFASQFLDGLHAVIGTAGATDTLVVTDNATAVIDTDFSGISSVETLQLGAAKTGAYDVTVGTKAKAAGITTVDTSLAGTDVKVTSTGFTAPLTIIAGAKSSHFTDGAGAATFVFAPKNLDAADVLVGGTGIDSLQLSGSGAVAAAAFSQVSGVEKLILSGAGNTVALTDAITFNADTSIAFNGHALDFMVVGGKGNDNVDLSQITKTDYLGILAGAGNDKLTGSAGKDTWFFFLNPGDLTSADQIKGGPQGDEVVVCAGTYKADVFKGMSRINEFTVDDQAHPTLGSVITVDNNAVQQTLGGDLTITIIGTGSDRVDAAAVTDPTKRVDINSGGGNDVLIGPAGGGHFVFNDDGTGGFLLDANDKVVGGSTGHGIITLEDATGTGVTLNDADLGGVSNISQIDLSSSGHVTLNFGGKASAAGIAFIDGTSAADFTLNAGGTTQSLTVLMSDGADIANLGSGDDTFKFAYSLGGKLSSADHIDGGGGRDTLFFFLDATVTDVDLTNVTHVEAIKLLGFSGGAGSSFTLGAEAEESGIDTVDAGAATAAVSVDAAAMGSAVTLLGSDFADTLKGSSAWDTLVGGYGKDTLTGGFGGDQFKIESAADSRQMPGGSVALADFITDFNINQLDTIHLEGLGLNSSSVTERAAGPFVTATTSNFFGGNDIAVQSDNVSETRLYADVNHNGTFDVGTDVMVRLVGANQAHDLATNPILIVT